MCGGAPLRGPTVAARVAHRSVFGVIDELHRRVSSDELQDVPAGEPTADGDGQNVHIISPVPPQRISEPGWDPRSGVENPH